MFDLVRNFALMENELIKILSEDEVVRYIAYRHGKDATELVGDFLAGNRQNHLGLLDNEILILSDLAKRINSKII